MEDRWEKTTRPCPRDNLFIWKTETPSAKKGSFDKPNETKAFQILRHGGKAAAYKRARGILMGYGAMEGVDVNSRGRHTQAAYLREN